MNKIVGVVLQSFLWAYFVISVYPLIWMVSYSLKNNDEIFVTNPFGLPTHFRYENYVNAWNKFSVPTYITNSMIVSTITTIGVVLFAVMFAYAIARLRWKFRETVRIYMIIGMFIPIQVIIIPLAIIVKDFHLTNTYGALLIPYIAFGLPFASMVFYGFLRGIPQELEESACMDGASIYLTFFRIMLPILTPAVATIVILQFMGTWNEFFLASILITKEELMTLPIGLIYFQGLHATDWGGMGAVMTIASLPMVVLYLIFTEQVESALTVSSAVKG
ncbi:carbohydrate ABC transporter permease [Paenibacillus chondroitinus]|uniref:Carbohydrate ABC transporter permease n=1 Tax=Paenibacillus chondroitinus TaxID=59842 RepID=A0ABU6DMS1_9BACL|nr:MULTISPECIES: carbohydrate ABC transporter permease [Paenibacillus]MCY9660679.1 carbohydrate ABC transporter permease [Paenibacillus anseongense]MEB4798141.1 carbohydrate ABC transporter permease [Paenibacillus chondroitinus]